MKKTFINIVIFTIVSSLFACGSTNFLDLLNFEEALKYMSFASSGSDGPIGNDVISSTTNMSGKEEETSSKLDPLSGASFVKPPEINNYGTVNLSYDVEVPQGRAGMQPGVGLSYSSTGGDGLVGIGWSLSTGLGVISRTTQNGQLYYDYRDTFTFNGKRLVKVEGPAESEEGVYRLEIESGFSRFVLSDIDNGGVWTVYDKAGTVTVFGKDSSSRIYHPDDEDKTYIWNFNRSTDLNGNYMTAEYDDSDYEDDHILYLKEIRYTGNDNGGTDANQYLRFHYMDREDSYVSKAPGFIMRMDRLLDYIEVGWDDPQGIFGDNTELWRYTMEYGLSEDSNRQLLKTVKSTRHTTEPAFRYQPAEHSFLWNKVYNPNSGNTEVNPEATKYFEGDFNGDGISDMVFFNPETGYWKAAEALPGGGYVHKTYGRRFQGYDSADEIQWFKGNVTGDYNGDGRSDIAFYLPQTKDFWVAEHDGHVFQFRHYGRMYISSLDMFKCEWFTGDFDGNGLSDAVLFNEPTGEWYLMANTGGSFEFIKFSQHFKHLYRSDYSPDMNMDSPATSDNSDHGRDRDKIHFLSGDYNGDGRTDISFYDDRNGKWWVAENYRDDYIGFKLEWKLYKVFTAPEEALFGHDRFSGDFNGDGFSDFLIFDRDTGEWTIGETGNGTITFRKFSRAPQFKEITRWLQGDFNGDGRTDIGFFSATDNNFWIGEATPYGFRYRIYNNLAYGPDPDDVLRTPLPKDEVEIESARAVVSGDVETAIVDYQYDNSYYTDRGERVFSGYFKKNVSAVPEPGLLVFQKNGNKWLYQSGSTGNNAVETAVSIDLEDDGIKLLDKVRPKRYFESADGAGIAYYMKDTAGRHNFRVIESTGGVFSAQGRELAQFTNDDIKDFDFTTGVFLTDRFDESSNDARLLILNDRAEPGPRWGLSDGAGDIIPLDVAVAGSGITLSGFKDTLKAIRENRTVFQFFSGRFIDGKTASQIVMVDKRGSDHKWYVGFVSLDGIGGGTVTFRRLDEGYQQITMPDGYSGICRIEDDGKLLIHREIDGRAQFLRYTITQDSADNCFISAVTYYPLSSDISFKGEFTHLDRPVVYTADGVRAVEFTGTRCELEELTATAVSIRRDDLMTRVYVYQWIQGDYNGDGKTDIGIFHLKERNWYFALTQGTVPDMISSVDNGIGGTYTMEYENSTRFDNTGADDIPDLPMNYKVCVKLSVNDGFNRTVTSTYEYEGGYAFSAFINGYKETDYFGFGTFTSYDALGSHTISQYNNVPYSDYRKNRALAGAVKETRFIGRDHKEYGRAEYDYRIHVIDTDRVDWKDQEVLSYLIEPTQVRKYMNGVQMSTTASKIDLLPGKYEMTGKTEAVTDHYTDGIHQPTTVMSFSEFENIDSTNEMRLVRKVSGIGNVNSFFDIHGEDPLPTGTPNETTSIYEYDGRGNLTHETTGYTGSGLPAVSQREIAYAYDGYGNRIQETDLSGTPNRIAKIYYDERLHQFVTKVEAVGNSITLTTLYEINYESAFGGINKKTDPNGNSTYFSFDKYGRLSRQHADVTGTRELLHEYEYDTDFPMSGKVTQYTGTGEVIKARTFADGAGRPIHTVRSATDEAGKRYVKTGKLVFDIAGRIIRKSQTDWAGDDEIDRYRPTYDEKHPTITEYDASGRVQKVTLPEGFAGEGETSTTFTYNDPWETVSYHSVGRSKRSVKNARGQILYIEESGTGDDGQAVSAKLGFAYDIAGKRTKKMDLNGAAMSLDVPAGIFSPGSKDTSGNNIAAWRYDAFGQVRESSDPDLGYAGLQYNSFGDVTARTDALNRTTDLYYDGLGRLIQKVLPGSEGAVTYTYDSLTGSDNALGRMVAMDDPAQRKEFSYDRKGRVKRETREIKNAGSVTYETLFQYDLLDREIQITYPEDPKSERRTTVTYSYSAMGPVSVLSNNGESDKGIITDIDYNEFGQMTRVERGNGTITYYEYDIKGRLSNLLTTASHNGQTWKLQDVTYQFKVDNSITGVENRPDVDTEGGAESVVRYEYRYDGLNRLVGAEGFYQKEDDDPLNPAGFIEKKFRRGYGYAANGNMTSKTIFDPDTGSVDDHWVYQYSNHAATGITTTKSGFRFDMAYDASGNMTYQRDNEKGMAKQMAYDSYNRIREVTDPDTGNLMGQYWYDDQGFRVLKKADLDVEGETRKVELRYPSMYFGVEIQRDLAGNEIEDTGYGVSNIYLNGVRIAACLPNGDARYYLTDQVDSVKVVVDDNGQAVTRTEYLPYGETWFQEGDTNHAPKYNSQELDKETNFYFYNARHYDPEIARFVTPDTVVAYEDMTHSWNRYMYVRGNPIVYMDPTGHVESNPFLAMLEKIREGRNGSTNVSNSKQVAYWEKVLKDNGYDFNNKDLNIIGIRRNDKKYGKNKANDIFIVIENGEIKGVFMGSTEPGEAGHSTLRKGQYKQYKRLRKWELGGNNADMLYSGGKSLPVDNDTINYNGILENNEIERNHKCPLIMFHYGGQGKGELLTNKSHGCQVITGNKFIDSNGNIVTGEQYTGKQISNWKSKYKDKSLGAYEAFSDFVFKSDKPITYTLINESQIQDKKYYNMYRSKLYGD